MAPFVGTDRLGRPLTNEERDRCAALLRAHDFAGARRYARLFAVKQCRNAAGAEDLVSRACLRLVRLGWDPNEVPLASRLARLVWSEWTHAVEESKKARDVERAFARELQVTEGKTDASVEQRAVRLEDEQHQEAHAREEVGKLRAAMVDAGDTVNLLWLDFTLQGLTDMKEMARRSGRRPEDFYAATKRRARMVRRLAAAARGVILNEEADPKDEGDA
jgi:hypothetical protein